MKINEYIKQQKQLAEDVRNSWKKDYLNDIYDDFSHSATTGETNNPAQQAVQMVIGGEKVSGGDVSKAWNDAFKLANRNFLSDQLVSLAPTVLKDTEREQLPLSTVEKLKELEAHLISFNGSLLRVSIYDYEEYEERILVGTIGSLERMINGIEVEIPNIVRNKAVDVEVEAEKFYASTES